MTRPSGSDRTAARRVRFRPLVADDLPRVAGWLAAPHVRRWWHHDTDPAALDRDFGPVLRGEEPAEDLMVLLDPPPGEPVGPAAGPGTPVGLLQRCRWDDYPDERAELAAFVDLPAGAVTIDYLIGPVELTGHGLGPRIVAAAVADVWRRYPDAPCVIVPVHADNRPSWRTLCTAGFRFVTTAELAPDNPADDRRHVVHRVDRPVGSGDGTVR